MRQMSEFGAAVYSLSASRGIRRLTELSALMERHGYKASASSFSNWCLGKHSPSPRIPQAVAEVLALGEEERIRLAMAYTYGQDVPARSVRN